ncbi:uncharacterized protein N7500_007550 [Penicillium coprophilum]|uniref:uncharacterized protein n=1 Tax=Penicillium coprophilum TaxID=36646 RepID=UPI002391E565|nr:uncharacterized protein N7500_007550 [Penicillium coprophilum]KAJ5165720.1 hypothetical protein N7500_007550 [Penicillium coprophilum]
MKNRKYIYGRSSLYHTSGARDNALTGTNGTAADGKTAVGTAGNALDSPPSGAVSRPEHLRDNGSAFKYMILAMVLTVLPRQWYDHT